MKPIASAQNRLPALSPEDRALWDALKTEVTPLVSEHLATVSMKTEFAKQQTPKAPKPHKHKGKGKEAPPPAQEPLVWQAPGRFAKTLATMATRSPIAAHPAAPRDLRATSAKGLDRANADRLRRGKMPIEARLDLHGQTQDEAHRALTAFIENAARLGKRHVLVITGKGLSKGGQGVLRARVPQWLGEGALARWVLAFSYAQKRDGEHGALYVLLRRQRG